jgi:hypothetical protein
MKHSLRKFALVSLIIILQSDIIVGQVYPTITPISADVCITDPLNNTPLGNVALYKSTQQSSTCCNGMSTRAVDGNTDSYWGGGSLSHTNNDPQAWWRVDLQGIYYIDFVRLFNRSDCCQSRLSDFYVHTSETPIPTNLQDALNDPNVTSTFYGGTVPTGGEDVTINSSARWVVVQHTGTGYVCLAEFEAYASIETHQPLSISNLSSYNSLQWSRNYNNTGWTTISDAQNLEDYGEVYTAPGFYNYRTLVSSNSIYTTDVSSVTVHAETVPGTISGPDNICLGAATGNTLTLTGSVGDIQWQQSSNSAGPYTDIVGATNTTYVVNTSSPSVSYYRAKVTSGTCGSLYTQGYEVTVAFCPNVWTGLQSTDWASGGNWSTGVAPQPIEDGIIPSTPTGGLFPIIANSVVVDDLVIEPGAVLTVATGGSIIVTSELNSDGTVYVNNGGSLVQASGGTLVGTGTYHINRVGSSVYDYWSSPITNGSVSGSYQYNPLLGTYDPSDDLLDPGWVSGGSSMAIGKGYAAQGLGSRTFVGTINNGNVSVAVQYVSNPALSSNPGVAYNLVGNPYPSGLSLPSFVSANSSMLETAAVYLWDDPGAPPYTSSGYATWSTGGSVAGGGGNVPTNNIGSCQGFKVRVTGNGNLIFNNAMRVADNPLMLFRESEMNRLWLNVNSGVGSFNQTLVGFADDATEGVDFLYDAPKLDPISDLSVYSLMGDEPYAIQFFDLSLPRIIPLGLAVAHDTPVTFSIGGEDNMQNHEILLEDRLLDVNVNLKEGLYQFQASTEQYLDRFYLHVIPPEVSGTEQILADKQCAVYYHNDRLYISNRGNLDDKDAVVHLFDMSGRMVLEFTVNEVVSGHKTFDISALQDGVYVVRVLNAGAEFNQKIMKY